MKQTQKYNALIVDDEIFIRNGLTNVLQNSYPKWNLLGSAGSCQEAYDFFQKHPVDLLITDIQMPQKNGLDLIEDLREKYPSLEIIIISGYDNFAYAKRAMQNKIVHYLLKPLNLEEFHSAMQQVEQSLSLKKDAIRQEEIRHIQYTNSIINDLLNGNLQAEQVLTAVLGNELIPYVTLCMDMYQDGTSPIRPISLMQTEIYNMLKKLGTAYFSKCLIFFRNKQLWCAVIPGNEMDCIEDFITDIKNLLTDIDSSIQIASGISMCGYSTTDFVDCFRQAYIASRSFLNAQTANAMCQYHKENYAKSLIYDSALEARILNKIRCGNIKEAGSALEEFINNLLASAPDIFMITKATQRLSYSIMKCLEKYFPLDDTFLELFETLQDLNHIHTKKQLYSLIFSYVDYSCCQFQVLSSNRQSRIVQYIMQYIEEHYTEDLSLDLLSEKVDVSSNYLSTHFKAETNMNVIEYLTFVRLEKAKDLLQNSHMKIQQIADATGYHDPKYFNRIFKKNIGITPREYRNISNLS